MLTGPNECKQEYYANIVLGDAKMKTAFPTLAIEYANWVYDYNIDTDSTLKYIHEIDKKLSGVEEVMGTLSLTNDSVAFTFVRFFGVDISFRYI